MNTIFQFVNSPAKTYLKLIDDKRAGTDEHSEPFESSKKFESPQKSLKSCIRTSMSTSKQENRVRFSPFPTVHNLPFPERNMWWTEAELAYNRRRDTVIQHKARRNAIYVASSKSVDAPKVIRDSRVHIVTCFQTFGGGCELENKNKAH
jgi:hypothetical protein